MRFQDKVAIVTGGGSGIGKEVTTRFVAEGGVVVINGRNAPKAEAAAREIDATGTRVAVYAGDVSPPATGEALARTALDRFDGTVHRESHEGRRPRRRHRADRIDVGLAGNRRDAVFGLFGGEGRRLRAGQEPRDRAGGRQDRVNAIAPAVIETPVYDTFLTPEQVKEVLPTFNAIHPLGRNGQLADVVEALLFLASDQARVITGVVLPVDGGVMAGRQ
jgi:NAD(P)-dependent dehydrogenase (short-subunit alcohol dehydrogenase family)